MKKSGILALLALFPTAAQAQSLQTFIQGFVGFLDNVVLPFLLGIGFLFFLINTIRYFVIGGASDEGREKAKYLAIYSVAAFVVIVIFWGIVNITSDFLGLGCTNQPTPDYIDPDSVDRPNNPCGEWAVAPLEPTNGSPENLLPPNMGGPAENMGGAPAGSIACSTNLGDGRTTTIITTPSDCSAQGGSIVGNNPGSTNNPPAGAGTVEEEDPDVWFGGWIRTFPRPFRDYFWTNWGRGGSSDGSTNDPEVDCLLPNNTIEELRLSECLNRGGQEILRGGVQGGPAMVDFNGNGGAASVDLINCEVFDPTTGSTRIIQTSSAACADFNNVGNPSGNLNGPQPVDLPLLP